MSACADFGGTLPGFQLLRDGPDGVEATSVPSSKEQLPHLFSVFTYSES